MRNILRIFLEFLKYKLNFELFEKEDDPHS